MNRTLYTEYRAARQMGYSAKTALQYTREALKIAELGLPRYPQDAVIRRDGVMYTIKVESDSDSSPFEWDCFYGIPEQAGRRYQSDDRPGYARIAGDRTNWYYPRAEALAEYMRQMVAHDRNFPRGTRFEQACEAVDKEINYWHDWLNDDRYFIGVIVTAESPEGFEAKSSLWGVEAGDSSGYWRSCAADLISECAGEIESQRKELINALDDALEADFAGIEFCGF